MIKSETGIESLMAEAERKGKEEADIEARNKKRRAKGRKPIPSPSERKDKEVLNKRYRTGDSTTVSGEDALKLYELRKDAMAADDAERDDDAMEDADEGVTPARSTGPVTEESLIRRDPEDAQKAAEAARRIQDLKNKRIDHEGNWSDEGQKLDKGDETKLVPSASSADAIWAKNASGKDLDPRQEAKERIVESTVDPSVPPSLVEFRKDLYERLKVSFGAIEQTLSDLQGRVSEIVTAGARAESAPEFKDEFEVLLSKKTPVVFDVGGTQMSFDAITVFHAPPCITVVSKIGAAKITPKPGAQLRLTYSMDGQEYRDDPVTFLGTRFELPMFGLSFVGFIRDMEADMMDASAGISESATEEP